MQCIGKCTLQKYSSSHFHCGISHTTALESVCISAKAQSSSRSHCLHSLSRQLRPKSCIDMLVIKDRTCYQGHPCICTSISFSPSFSSSTIANIVLSPPLFFFFFNRCQGYNQRETCSKEIVWSSKGKSDLSKNKLKLKLFI